MPRLVLMSTPCPDTWGGVEADWEIKILKRPPANQHHTSFNHPQPEISSHTKTIPKTNTRTTSYRAYLSSTIIKVSIRHISPFTLKKPLAVDTLDKRVTNLSQLGG